MIGTEWSPDDDPADLVSRPHPVMVGAPDFPDGFEVLREVSVGVRAAILAAVPETDRALVAHLVAEGTPRAWAQAHGMSILVAVIECGRVEAKLPDAFYRAYDNLGPVAAADDRLLRAWIDVHAAQVPA